MILETNNDSTLLLALLGKLLRIIHIAVPILLIVFITYDLVKALISQDDEMISRTVRSIRNRMIAGIVVFFIPTIVEFLLSKVFISLNMDSNEYNRIMSSYKTFIHADKININSSSKSNDINNKLEYSLDTKENPQVVKNEINFATYSKTLTPYVFDKNSFNGVVQPITTENFKINYKDKNYKLTDKLSIKYDSITVNETIDNGNYIIGVVTLSNAVIDNNKYKSAAISYYYLKTKDSYKLDKIDIVTTEEVDDYLNKTEKSEDLSNKANLSITKYISSNGDYDYSKLDRLSDSSIKNIFEKNKNKVVSLNTSLQGIVTHASGFFIRRGLVATSWSYVKTSLVLGKNITVHIYNDHNYTVAGVVLVDEVNDIAILKLNEEIGESVVFASKDNLVKNDTVVAITSKTGYAFSAIAGIVSSNDTSLISVLPVTNSEWGAPIFNTNGNVVASINSKIVSSELCNATNTQPLVDLQTKLNGTKFSDIKYQTLNDLKKDFHYVDSNKEKIEKTIPNKVWKKYKKIGNIEETIQLNLIKTSYYENIVSLRYQNVTNDFISKFSFADEFLIELEKEDYKKVSETTEKLIYKKGSKQVVLISEFDYLIVILVDGGIL